MTYHQLAHAKTLLELRRYSDAETELGSILAVEPANVEAHILLAQTWFATKRYRDALKETKQALQLDPNNARGHFWHAKVWLVLKKTKRAKKAIQEAIRLDPNNAGYYAILSTVYFYEIEWQKAFEAAERGLALDPTHLRCLNLRAQMLRNLGRADVADQSLKTSLALSPEDAVTHTQRGIFLLEQGDFQEATEHFQEALRVDPNSDMAQWGLAETEKAKSPIYRLIWRYHAWALSRAKKVAAKENRGCLWSLLVITSLILLSGYSLFARIKTAICSLDKKTKPE